MPDINFGNCICVIAFIILFYAIYKDLSRNNDKKIIALNKQIHDVKNQTKDTSDSAITKDDSNINDVHTQTKPINTTPPAHYDSVVLYKDIDYEGEDKVIKIGEQIKLVEYDTNQKKPYWYYKSLKINGGREYNINFVRKTNNILEEKILSENTGNIRNIEQILNNISMPSACNNSAIYIDLTEN